jgi:hypothetical protein
MTAYPSRRWFLGAAAACLVGGAAPAQQGGDPYRTVAPYELPLDKPGVYTLHFRYAPPRIITVDIPGKGKKQVWYMFYQVFNRTDLPQSFIPEFELVTKDLNTRHLDEPQPVVVEAIKKIEDPTGALNLLTSNTIALKEIPVTKPDSVPRYVSGVAVWTDVPERAARTNRFSVYVFGLSNGVATVETADGGMMVKRKALRLDFFKPTDEVNPRAGDIRIEDNQGLGGEKWDYVATTKRKPTAAPAKPKDEGK